MFRGKLPSSAGLLSPSFVMIFTHEGPILEPQSGLVAVDGRNFGIG